TKRKCSIVNSPREGQLSLTVDGVKHGAGELGKPSLSESPREVGPTASRKLMRAPALVDGMRTRDEEMWTVVRKLRDVSKAYTKLRCPEGNGHVHGPYDVVEGSLGKLESANKRGFENCAELIRRFSSLPLPNCSAAPRISRLKLPHPPEWAKGSLERP
ncbi:hypothetical protein FOZ63_022050, partial [Perkinsus olseni]